ncbi:MAG: hypothetical protein QW622_02540 [Candidatus Pacearchaeota archaeon]
MPIKEVLKQKKAQVTIFILIAIAIFAVLVIMFYPKIKIYFVPSTPVSFIDECIKGEIDKITERVSLQGGSSKPDFYYSYKGNKIEYLCYTNQYYKTCTMQRPLLKQHIESEIKDYIEEKARSCVYGLKEEMEKRGYSVSMNYQGVDVSIVPGNIIITLNAKMNMKKEEATESFNKFEIKKKSEIYNLVMLTTNILNSEARYGDTNIINYMFYYPEIKVEKLKQGDGSKVYILTNTGTNEKFMFATRSLSWPGGYKLNL